MSYETCLPVIQTHPHLLFINKTCTWYSNLSHSRTLILYSLWSHQGSDFQHGQWSLSGNERLKKAKSSGLTGFHSNVI